MSDYINMYYYYVLYIDLWMQTWYSSTFDFPFDQTSNFQSTLCWNCNVTMAFPCTIIIKLLFRFSYLKIDSKIISCDRLNKFLQSTPINFRENVSWKLDAKLHRVTAPVDFVWSHAKSKVQPSCRQMDRPSKAVSKLPIWKGP